MINDKVQDIRAKCDGLLQYNFIFEFAGERIGENLAKLHAKWLVVSYAPFALRLLSSKTELAG